MSTEHLYKQRDEAAHQLECIQKARDKAYAEIKAAADRLVMEALCSEKDAWYFLDRVDAGLEDMLEDIVTQRPNERDTADEAISNIEYRDLMRSRPVL